MLSRRRLLQTSVAALALPALPGCGEARGPVDVAWGRDACEYCRMIISERQFAAQLRAGPKARAYKFDDIGCAFFWSKQQGYGAEQVPEIWVMDYETGGTWLDARQAHFRVDVRSPMNYNFGAVAGPQEAAVPFAEMERRIGAGGSHSLCLEPVNTASAER